MTFVKLLILSVFTFSISALADDHVILCSANGYGIAKLTVEEIASGPGIIKVIFDESDEALPVTYTIVSGLKDLKSSTSATLVAQEVRTKDDEDNGKHYEKAVLLRIAEGKKRAFFAVDGNVHRLLCY